MQSTLKKIYALIYLDVKVEYRNKFEILGLLLFVIIVSYVAYRALSGSSEQLYNFVFWVLLLVLSTNFALRSFTKMNTEESRYLYQLSDASSIIFSKIVFNWVLIFVGGLVLFLSGVFFLTYTFPISKFILLIALTSLALSAAFSLPSALSISTSSRSTLLGILAFPVSIPIVLVSSAIGNQLLVENVFNLNGIIMLISIALIMSSVSLVLFRFTWQS